MSIWRTFFLIIQGCLGLQFTSVCSAGDSGPLAANPQSEFIGWQTNGRAVFELHRCTATNQLLKAVTDHMATNAARSDVILKRYPGLVRVVTNRIFSHYTADSLNHLIWTNFVANTNGRSMLIWAERRHPLGWPLAKPVVAWNKKSLLFGMRGFTALSPCWSGEVNSGQVPITALTRRHGYTRGHGMGPNGYTRRFNGEKVWFLSADDQLAEVKVLASIVRTRGSGSSQDYAILLFDRDLPASIRPMRVAAQKDVWNRYQAVEHGPVPIFQTEQSGHVCAGVPPFVLRVAKGGDSGSPDMLPLPGELIFFRGRTTSGPSKEMQQDMDELCRRDHLDPQRYQLQWFDLTHFPATE